MRAEVTVNARQFNNIAPFQRTLMKPVAELQPTITAHFKLSGVDFDRWTKEMQVWSAASHFSSAEPSVQAAFAQKQVEKDFDDKIREKAEQDGVELTFDNYVVLAEALFREQSSIFLLNFSP